MNSEFEDDIYFNDNEYKKKKKEMFNKIISEHIRGLRSKKINKILESISKKK